MEQVGQRIREERLKRHLTLEQLAERSGLSKSFLSQNDRGLAQPSVSSLKKIAGQFGTSVVQLFSDNGLSQNNFVQSGPPKQKKQNGSVYSEDIRVVRADLRKRLQLPASNISYDLLTPDLNRRLEVLYVRAAPGEHTGDEPMVNIPGEKFALVLGGELEITIGEEVFLLKKGDSIYHPAHIPHSWRSIGDDPVEIIWVMTPPSF